MEKYKNLVRMDPAAALWHYTSLDAIKAILQDRKLRLTRIDTYWDDDPFEGSVPKRQIDDQVAIFSSANTAQVESVAAHYPDMSPGIRASRFRHRDPWTQTTERRIVQARSIHVSCWSAAGESDVMWRLYCSDGRKGCGVALQSTFGQLEASLAPQGVLTGQIAYRRYDDGDAFTHDLDSFFTKRSNFGIETEVRLLKYNERHYLQLAVAIAGEVNVSPEELNTHIQLDWFPAEVVNRIRISPYADEGYATKVEDTIRSIDPSMADRLDRSPLSERYPPQR